MTLARWVLGVRDAKAAITFKNINSFDFRDGNLILCRIGQPVQNRSGAQRNSKSKIRGVSWYKKYQKWNGQVHHKGKNYNVGYNDDIHVIEQAVIAKRLELLELSFKDQELSLNLLK